MEKTQRLILKKRKMTISPFRLSSLLRQQDDPSLAFRLFQNPNPDSTKPFRYTFLSYDLIITKLGRAKMFPEMETVLKQLKQETRFAAKEVLFCNVIDYYGRARLVDKAFSIFHQIPEYRCYRSIKSFNSLLNVLLRRREFDRMIELVSDVESYASPDVCFFNIVINGLCLRGDMEKALKMFDEIHKRGLYPNDVTFATLVNGLCRNGRLEDALKLKEHMVTEYKVRPNLSLYTSLIKGFCGKGDVDSAIKLKEKMVRDGLQLDTAVYTTLVSGLFKVGRKEDIAGVLDEMGKNGCKDSVVMCNARINGHCKDRDLEAAFSVLDEMVAKGFKPDVVSYNVLIDGLCKEGRLREANDLLEDMPRHGCVPDVVAYRSLFDGLCDAMQYKEAAFILDEMVFKGYAPRPASINKFLNALCNEGKTELLWTAYNSIENGNIFDAETWGLLVPLVLNTDEQSPNAYSLVQNVITSCKNCSADQITVS